jgi:hypothetical protein
MSCHRIVPVNNAWHSNVAKGLAVGRR